ncbi:MAG: GIY-YIG nuclease family protein [Candidatus Poribacteria bacterium]|nr:GIY-YIG nuclease family protein [Candidatus Poribacteria bacterium]
MAAGPKWGKLLGESGHLYPFKFYALNMVLRGFPKFTDVPGVYTFAKEKHNNITGHPDYDPLYVGETKSFQDRIVETHSHWECADKHGSNYIGIYEMPDSSPDERKAVEDDIIDKYVPPCNKTSTP